MPHGHNVTHRVDLWVILLQMSLCRMLSGQHTYSSDSDFIIPRN